MFEIARLGQRHTTDDTSTKLFSAKHNEGQRRRALTMTRRSLFLLASLIPYAGTVKGDEPSRGERVGNLTFKLGLNSVFPASSSVESGWYSITLRNGVTTGEVEYLIEDERGLRLGNKRSQARSGRSSMLVKLTPGKHMLRIIGEPRWTAEINVSPAK